jgi:hypothetical protein
MYASSKGASMQKLPLSVTMGPAFIFAIRKLASGDPAYHNAVSEQLIASHNLTHRVCAGFEAVWHMQMARLR